jgi:arylsulfatase A-like enzyme
VCWRCPRAKPGARGPGAPRAKPDNILLILSEEEHYRLLSAQGYELPARRRLAERGVTFRNHYVAAAMCSPSRAALLTGLPPQRNGVFDQPARTCRKGLRTASRRRRRPTRCTTGAGNSRGRRA